MSDQQQQQQISVQDNDVNIPQDNIKNSTSITKTTVTMMISVKDFAYDEDEDLHYGVGNYSQYLTDEENYNEDMTQNNNNSIRDSIINIPKNYYFEDGPPWKEDPDLKTPMIKDDSKNEFEFSIASSDEIHGKAIALFDFTPENDNEVGLKEGQIIWISYRHGQGWLVAEDSQTGETGLVPEEYVQLVNDLEFDDELDEPRRFLPDIVHNKTETGEDESDWVDEDDDELPEVEKLDIK